MIKVARVLVVYQAYQEREEEASLLACRMPRLEAYEQAGSLLQRVRTKASSFLVRIPGGPTAEATVMDWVFDTLAYGRRIQHETAVPSTIDWTGDRIRRHRVQFRIGQLSDMLHTLVDEARGLLGELTYTASQEELPRIDWVRAEDDHSDETVGYSFLTDDRNRWVTAGRDWVVRRIACAPETAASWFRRGRDDDPYYARAVKAYGLAVEAIREKLWLLLHLVGGQPARGTEIIGLRYQNTVYGVRDIFLYRQTIIFLTKYHKTYNITRRHKLIYRSVPQGIGKLLVWYL